MKDRAKPSHQTPFAYRIDDACAMLGGISRATLYRLFDSGELSRVRITKRIVGIPHATLVQYAKSRGIDVVQ